jgi:biotin carboxyl carrier protein
MENSSKENGNTTADARSESLRQTQRSASRRANIAVSLIPVLVILITFLFWYQTWFGRQLSDREMQQYLTDTSVPHKSQHALAQVADEIARDRAHAARWYPQVLALAENKEAEFRLMSAWVMGQDNQSPEFHQALRRMLEDSQPMVRRNAALALVRFGDASGEAELRNMLEPFDLVAPAAGTLSFRLKVSDEVPRGSVVARVQSGGAEPVEVHSPVEGVLNGLRVSDGTTVAAGETIAILAPSEQQIWESLRGLYLVGGTESLADVERFMRNAPEISERIRTQAAATANEIRRRAKPQP